MILTRETKFNMVLDFTAGTIGYMDYVGFLQGANEDYMDVSGFPTEDNDGNPFLMQCTRTMILYGDMTILDLKKYNIPVLCGFPGGHGDVNLPLMMGAPVTLDVRSDGATLQFDIDGEPQSYAHDSPK